MLADLLHRRAQAVELLGGIVPLESNSAQHREQMLFVVVIHLDFRDPSPLSGDVVDDRIGQSDVVRSESGDDDFHFEAPGDIHFGSTFTRKRYRFE